MVQKLDRLFGRYKKMPFGRFCLDTLVAILRRLIDFNVVKAMTLTLQNVEPKFIEPHPQYSGRFIQGEALLEVIDPKTGNNDTFVKEQIEFNSFCYALYDGASIVSYSWYLDKPHTFNRIYRYHFDQRYLHMFNAYAHPDYRGRRLNAYCIGAALLRATELGYKGLISEVGISNFSSLRSCAQLGFVIMGFACHVRLFGRGYTFRSKGCKRNGYWLEPIRDRN